MSELPRVNDETWVPFKWIYTIVASCIVSLASIVGAVWYVAAIAAKSDVASAQILEIKDKQKSYEVERQDLLMYLRSIDSRLSRIEGQLKVKE